MPRPSRLPRALAAAVLLLVTPGFAQCDPEDALSLLMGGFTMLSPPSNLVSPGAVVLMLRDEQGRAQLQTICGPRAALSKYFSARVSETLSSSFRMTRSQRLGLQAEAVDRFKARVKSEEVASVSVELTRPRVVALDESDFFTYIDDRTEACQKAIDSRMDAGFAPTVVTQAYIADVQYIVTFLRDRQMTKRVREEKMARIAANLGGGHTEITEHAVKAQNLTLAVRTDPYLISIRPSASQPPAMTPPPRDDGFGPESAEVLPEPVAPYVAPAGGFVNPYIGG